MHAHRDVWEDGAGPVELDGYGHIPQSSILDSRNYTDIRVVVTEPDYDHEHSVADHPGTEHPGTYRPPKRLRERIYARDRTCRFPGCNRRARACQLDHSIPWPHGPTCECNMAALCVRHHRLKTHSRWRLAQPFPGVLLWRTPAGDYLLVDHTGTHNLTNNTVRAPAT